MRRFTVDATRELTTEDLGDYVDGVAASLAQRPELAHLAPAWDAHLTRCDAAEANNKSKRRTLNRARIGYWIRDAMFDAVLGKTSSETYHLAGKDELAEPYVSFFGTVKAEEIKEFGEAKATAYGRTTVAKEAQILAALTSDGAKAAVQALIAELGQSAAALATAGTAREDARTALAALDIDRRKLIRDTTTLIAETEIGILTVHKGRRDLVDAVLVLDHEATRTPKKKPRADDGGSPPNPAPT